MKKESISQKLLRHLDASAGRHSQIASEVGISQATISRIYLRKVSPSLRNVEALMNWFEADDEKQAAEKSALEPVKQAPGKSALSLPHAKRVRVSRAESTAATAVA